MVVIPNIEFILQDPSIDPSGSRHLHSSIKGFIKTLGTSPLDALEFGSVQTSPTGAISDTKLIYARVSSLGSASGIMNMRLFWTNISAWTAGTFRFLEQKSIHFIPNLVLNAAAKDSPTLLPSTANLSGTLQPGWTGGSPWISGIADQGCSEYTWIATLVGNDVPNGLKGGPGLGNFRLKLLYDFS